MIITGILVVLGWIFDIAILTSLIPNAATMKFNTAWGFIVLGGAIFLQINDLPRSWLILAKILAANALILGILSIFQYIFLIDLGIDELIVNDSKSRVLGNPFPGRMSLGTAFCFSLMGVVAFSIKSKNKNTLNVIQAATHLITLLSFIAIIGYIFNVPEKSKLPFLSSMAIHTSMIFFSLSIAITLFYPSQGISKFFLNKEVGNTIGRKIFLQTSGVILLIAYLRILLDRFDLVSVETGTSLIAILFIVVSLFLIRRISNQLNFVESKKKEVEANLTQLTKILDSIPDLIIISDQQGDIQLANLRAEEVLGYKKKELIGLSIEKLVPKRFGSVHKSHRRNFFHSPYTRDMGSDTDLFIVKKDGQELPVEISLSSMNINKEKWAVTAIRDITQKKEANERYQLVSERLKTATEASNIGVWEYNIIDNQLFWDESMYRLYGTTAENFSGVYEAWERSLHPEDLDFAKEELQAALQNEKKFDTEFRIVTPEGSIHYIRAKAYVERDDQGSPLRMLGTNWDITPQKKAELELKQSNARNRIFIEQSPTAIAMFDKNMCYMAASQKWKEDYGLNDETLTGRSHYEIFPEIGDQWKKIHQECLEGAINTCDEAMFERQDGSIQWLSWVVRPWYMSKGQIGGILMFTADITKLKLAEAQKRQTEIILDKTSELARIGAWEVDLINEKVYWSKITREIHEVHEDYTPTVSKGINFYKAGEDRDKIQQVVQAAIEKGTPFDEELIIVTAKGNQVWVRAIGQAEFSNGKCKRVLGVFQDINKVKITENALNYANEEMRAILNTVVVSIIGTDKNGRITHFNRGAEILLGYSASEMINIHTPALIHVEKEVVQRGQELTRELGKPIEGFDVFVELARTQSYETREWTYVRKDGSTFPVQLSVSCMREDDGSIIGYLGVATDLTERKEMEAKLRKISILESKSKELEQFAYITSHDLREPLLTIENYVNLLIEDFGSDSNEEEKFVKNVIIDAVQRMDTLIKDILDYSRLGKIKNMTEVDLNSLLQNVCSDLHSQISSSHAKINIGKLPILRGHATELALLFQNLIKNAIKFCPKGSIPEIDIQANKITGGWQFEVRDNGIGIEEKNLEVIFQMFHRLNGKKEYEGTGIGLAQCKKVIEMHNGRIWVESTYGKSSCFYFTIVTD